MVECNKGGGRCLLVGYTDDRARKDTHDREKGIRRLEKAYKRGMLTKSDINRRGYNKFLKMEGSVEVGIDRDKIEEDKCRDGLKGYLANMNIPVEEVYAAYHNLWHMVGLSAIAKSRIDIRPMFHFTRKRIEAYVCICFVALEVYKERVLKMTDIGLRVDKVLALAETVTTIQVSLPKNKETLSKTMLMARHQKIVRLFDENFGYALTRSGELYTNRMPAFFL